MKAAVIEQLENRRMLTLGVVSIVIPSTFGPALAPPTLTGFSGTDTFAKGSSPIAVAPSITVADTASGNIAGATVTITNWNSNEDRLSFYNSAGLQNSFTVNSSTNTATLTLTGPATPEQYQTELRSINYWDVNNNLPLLTGRNVSIVVDAGLTNSSNILTGSIVVQNLDLPPVLSAIESTQLNYTANSTPAPISSTVLVNDPDSANLSKLTVQITSGYQNNSGGHDLLSFVNQNGITGSFNATTGMLTLTGNVPVGYYRIAVRSVTFSSTGTDVSTASRTLTMIVTDTAATPVSSAAITRNVTVSTGTFLPLSLTDVAASRTYVKGSAPMSIAPNAVLTNSASALINSATVTITNWVNNEDRLSFINTAALQNSFNVNTTTNTAVLTLTGSATAAAYQAELRSIAYQDVNDSVPVLTARNVTIAVADTNSSTANATTSITVQNVDLPPVVSAIETTPLVYVVTSAPVAISSTALVNDPDSANLSKMTVQITAGYQNNSSGHDVLSFVNQNGITGSFNASTGMLTLTGNVAVGYYRLALRSITFSAAGSDVSAATRTLTIIASDNAATPMSGIPVTRNISVEYAL